MIFGPDDDEAYHTAKEQLIQEFATWTRARGGHGHHADLLLDFKWGYVDGDLLTWRASDVDEFLVDWMPRKVSLPPDMTDEVVADAAEFFRFLAETNRLGKRSDDAARLVDAVDTLGADLGARMNDPARWGTTKSLVHAMQDDGVDPTDRAQMERWRDAFNARPLHEREAILGPSPLAPPGPILLPPRPRPEPERVRADADASPLLATMVRLADYLADGRALTKKGNVRLADARELVELLETGDEVDPVVGDRIWKTRSAQDLRGLDVIMTLARQARVVRVAKGRMYGVAKFRRLAASDPVAALDQLVESIWGIGPLLVQRPWSIPVLAGLELFVDAATASIVAAAYETAEPLDFEALVDRTIGQAERSLPLPDLLNGDFLDRVVRRDLDDAISLLARAQVVEHRGRKEREDRYGGSLAFGGAVMLTSYGIATCQRLLHTVGFETPVLEPFTASATDGPAVLFGALRAQLDAGGPSALVDAFDSLGTAGVALVETGWRTDSPEVLPVLESLGRHHLHKPTARSARKSVFRHRSWRANPR